MADHRSLADVLADAVCNIQELLSSEIRLAKAEAREELRAARSAGALILIGVLGGLLSAFFVLFSLAAALTFLIRLWAAALLVALAMGILCAVMLRIGAKRLRRSEPAGAIEVPPRRTRDGARQRSNSPAY